MSFIAHRSERPRHIILRAAADDRLPEALLEALAAERVAAGWLRASGVLQGVELLVSGASAGQGVPASTRRLAGPAHVFSLEGSFGLTRAPFALRAVLAHDDGTHLEIVAGEITGASVLALEVVVTVFEDVVAPSWSAAAAASAQAIPQPLRNPMAVRSSTGAGPSTAGALPAAGSTTAAMPQRPARAAVDFDSPSPEAGDLVDHFAFGRCEVVKTDGERLHIRRKDGRLHEIALEMLRVSSSAATDGDGGARLFKLERRL